LTSILRAFQKNKYHYGFSPDKEKFADIVLYVFSARCSFGVSYEMEFPKDALMKPQGDSLLLWRLS
jgi:hypothetical protein